MDTRLDLLRQIWERSGPGNIFLPFSKDGEWYEGKEQWWPDLDSIHYGKNADYNLYFTPTTYTNGRRITENMLPMGVLYADLDRRFDADRLKEVPPFLLWETSKGSYQAVWFLDRPYPISEAIPVNRGLSHYLRADQGSWVPTKVLRVPMTTNHKYDPPYRGRVLWNWHTPSAVYKLSDVPVAESVAVTISDPTPVPPVPSPEEHQELLRKLWPKLNHSARQMLTTHLVTDRSVHIFQTAREMAKLNISTDEIFQALYRVKWNKFYGRPELLWQSVTAASE